jgi:hypothetical protein
MNEDSNELRNRNKKSYSIGDFDAPYGFDFPSLFPWQMV